MMAALTIALSRFRGLFCGRKRMNTVLRDSLCRAVKARLRRHPAKRLPVAGARGFYSQKLGSLEANGSVTLRSRNGFDSPVKPADAA